MNLAIAHYQNVATYLPIFTINSKVQSTYPTICKKKEKPIINTDKELHNRKAKTYKMLAMTRFFLRSFDVHVTVYG
jgi:hypothetical protein